MVSPFVRHNLRKLPVNVKIFIEVDVNYLYGKWLVGTEDRISRSQSRVSRRRKKENRLVRVLMMPIVAAVLCAGAAVWTGAIWKSYSRQNHVASRSERKSTIERSKQKVKAQK